MTIPGAVVAVFGAVYDNTWCCGGWLFLGQCMRIPGAVVGGCFWDSV
jgi:hypothetical protein